MTQAFLASIYSSNSMTIRAQGAARKIRYIRLPFFYRRVLGALQRDLALLRIRKHCTTNKPIITIFNGDNKALRLLRLSRIGSNG